MTERKPRDFFSLKYVHLERRKAIKLGCILLWSVLLFLVFHKWVIGSVSISGNSMKPALFHSERFMFHRWPYHLREPRRGEIVVIEDPRDHVESIKRVVGLPGEVVTIVGGNVYINGKKLPEPYLRNDVVTAPGPLSTEPYRVPARRYFVLGDNRRESYDSRYIGAIRRDLIKGKIDEPKQ